MTEDPLTWELNVMLLFVAAFACMLIYCMLSRGVL
jgi:hypothetical protein